MSPVVNQHAIVSPFAKELGKKTCQLRSHQVKVRKTLACPLLPFDLDDVGEYGGGGSCLWGTCQSH